MVLGFHPDFVSLIMDGTKVHTIRAGYRWAAGQPIRFCVSPGPDHPPTSFRPDGVVQAVQSIRATQAAGTYQVEIDGRPLADAELAELVSRDGFKSPEQLFHFLAGYHGLPFEGQLIHWTALVY